MIFWRLEYSKHLEDSLSGEGARRHGGRWNEKDTPTVYVSSTLSLAALEKFVHAQPMARELTLHAIAVDIPDESVRQARRPEPLPVGWNQPEPRVDTMNWGSQWAAAKTSLAGIVPSVLLPAYFFEKALEFNLILNPEHPDMKQVRIVNRLNYSFDPRLWK